MMTTFNILQTLVNICVGKSMFSYTSLPFPVPVIDPLPTERFPEYVRDMLYGEENKLKTEFLVRAQDMV